MTGGQTPSRRIRVPPLEHICLPTDRKIWEDKDLADPSDPIEDFSEDNDIATAGSMAVAGRSPKHPRTTGSSDDSVDLAALFDRAADRFSACMDTKVDSIMDRLEKRIDERIEFETWTCDGQTVCTGENKQQEHKKWSLFNV